MSLKSAPTEWPKEDSGVGSWARKIAGTNIAARRRHRDNLETTVIRSAIRAVITTVIRSVITTVIQAVMTAWNCGAARAQSSSRGVTMTIRGDMGHMLEHD